MLIPELSATSGANGDGFCIGSVKESLLEADLAAAHRKEEAIALHPGRLQAVRAVLARYLCVTFINQWIYQFTLTMLAHFLAA